MKISRRDLLAAVGGISAGTILSGCSETHRSLTAKTSVLSGHEKAAGEAEVSAVEDLMREHGVMRRALFVYSETVARLRMGQSKGVLEPLHKTAVLFRAFGEDYHEKKLEEAYIFPAINKAGGEAAAISGVLVVQHRRGRDITEYILAETGPKKSGDLVRLAVAMESLVRMYRPHAAREDTIVFPAWKQTLTEQQISDMGEKFEEIERRQFGKDGFEDAVRQIAAIEAELGLADLTQFTALPL